MCRFWGEIEFFFFFFFNEFLYVRHYRLHSELKWLKGRTFHVPLCPDCSLTFCDFIKKFHVVCIFGSGESV